MKRLSDIKIDSNFNPNADFILFEGDCLKLLSGIPDKFIKLVVTSPPHNLGKDNEEN